MTAPALADLGSALAEAVESCLTDRPDSQALARARTDIDRYRGSEHSHLASVIRRPIHQIAEDLETFRR